MDLYSGYINKLIDELSGLPGIGSKSAQRLAFHLIGQFLDLLILFVFLFLFLKAVLFFCLFGFFLFLRFFFIF